MRRPHNSGTNDDDLKRKLSSSAIRRLLGLARPYAKPIILAAFLSTLSVLPSLVTPWLVRNAANRPFTL